MAQEILPLVAITQKWAYLVVYMVLVTIKLLQYNF